MEVKALDAIAPVHARQLNTYTRLAECQAGLLLNVGAPIMKDGVKRVIDGFPLDAAPRAAAETRRVISVLCELCAKSSP